MYRCSMGLESIRVFKRFDIVIEIALSSSFDFGIFFGVFSKCMDILEKHLPNENL